MGSGDATLVTPDAILGVWSMLLDGKSCAEASIMPLTANEALGVTACSTDGVLGSGMAFGVFFFLGIFLFPGD